MQILLVQQLPYPYAQGGGATKVNRLLLEGLAARGHTCRLMTFASAVPGLKGRAQFVEELANRGVRVTSSSPAADVFNENGVEVHAFHDGSQLAIELTDEIIRFRPTWTLISGVRSYLFLAVALEVSPSRVVYFSQSPATLPFGPACFRPDPSKTQLLGRMAGILTVGNYLKDYIRRWAGLEATAVHFPAYGPGPFPHLGSFDCGFVTMVNPSAIKGVAIFLELARRLPEAPFAAVPNWATRQADRARLEQLPNVRLFRPTEDIDEIFSQTRVVLVPSLWGEGFPLIAVEAMLRGIPVLASDVGGLAEAKLGVPYVLPVRPIERYKQAEGEETIPTPVVPGQDVGPWLQALQSLLLDRGHYEEVSAASQEAALRFVGGLSVGPLEEFLQRLGHATPSPAAVPRPSPLPSPPGQESPAGIQLPRGLSPQRLELLARLSRNKGGNQPKQ